ncbi:hypothetical protein D5952_14060 [Salmonella enterica subsp. enterica]|nr:hypothetical protein [Salmonella enterica subsp. enterica serovar Bonn]EBZ5939305.1 hypothetical protein [Salmonella enterica subsp. enterica serovar Muenchen]MLZ41048.1 hypothetical protein [Salmonella enterica subsp. enterica serovar Bonn]
MVAINNFELTENYACNDSITPVSASGTTQPTSKLYAGDSVFSYGLDVLFLFMGVLSDQANAQYSNMEAQSSAARKAQEHASTIDGQIADLASGKTTTLNPEVKKYIEDNKIEIDGVYGPNEHGVFLWKGQYDKITYRDYSQANASKTTQTWGVATEDGYINKYGNPITHSIVSVEPANVTFTAGELTAIKGALDSTANRATDFVSTAQLQLQKQMQTYNVCVSLINSMQSMLADMNKTIAQGIR